MDSLHVEVTGLVQGVGFRWFVVGKARELNLSGWVKNRGDGMVEVLAAGDPASLELLEAAIVAGPPGAQVQHVQKLPPLPTDGLKTPFGISR
ncbi:MAG: acylphosphatase [Gemmatimonadaceae bacterium]